MTEGSDGLSSVLRRGSHHCSVWVPPGHVRNKQQLHKVKRRGKKSFLRGRGCQVEKKQNHKFVKNLLGKKENIFHAEAHTVRLPTKIKNYDHDVFLRAPPPLVSGVKWFNRSNIKRTELNQETNPVLANATETLCFQ